MLVSIVASLKSPKVAQDESGIAEIILAVAFVREVKQWSLGRKSAPAVPFADIAFVILGCRRCVGQSAHT